MERRSFGPDLRLLVARKVSGNKPVMVRCPVHKDTDESLAIYPQDSYCYGACQRWFGYQDTIKILNGRFEDGLKAWVPVEDEAPEIDPADLPALAEKFHQWLFTIEGGKKLEYLTGEKRGLGLETIRLARLGHDGYAYRIPIYSFGELATIRSRRDGDGTPKYWGIRGLNQPYLYTPVPLAANVVWCEGEFDCLVAVQAGYSAVTMTNGVGTMPTPEILEAIWDAGVQRVTIALDQDAAAFPRRYELAELLERFIPSVDVRFARWRTKDLTELYLDGGLSALRRVLGEPLCQW